MSTVLFSDDFEDGNADGWTIAGGTWSVVMDGSYVYSQSAASARARASAGSSAWTDYAVTARIKPVNLQAGSSYYVALGARYQSSANFYFLDMRTDRIAIRRFVDNSSTVLSYTNYTVMPGTWYTVTLEVNGSTLKGYINGAQVLTCTDSTFSSGAIALSTYNATAEFDDVVVTTLTPAAQTLTVTRTGTGSGLVTSDPAGIECGITCTADFDSGKVVTLTAAADHGSSFIGWAGACTGAGQCIVTMNANRHVTATFSSDAQPMLFVARLGADDDLVTSNPPGISCGVTCAAGFDYGTIVTLTAIPGAFSTFAGWSGACASDPCIVTMDAAKQVTATFALVTFPLTVTKVGTGTVSSTPPGIACGSACAANFGYGTLVTLTAAPDLGYRFVSWDGACTGSVGCVVTMDAAKSVTATFAPFEGTPYDACAGYATLGAGTTGGSGGTVVTVTTLSELKDYAGRVGAYIIKIAAPISGSENVWVNSNKTIVGVGSGELIGVGLDMKKKDTYYTSNVIVRNLKISKVKASNDAIHLEGPNVHHIWIDHCDLSSDTSHGEDYYDGLLDITHAVDYVTVSWTVFHDHWKTSLIGHSDDNAAEDAGHFLVTYHHNYFYNVNSRLPSNRFGTLHSYNNYFNNLVHEPAFDANTGISSRIGACSRIENNYFDGVDRPILTDQSPTLGMVQLIDNVFMNYTSYATTPTCTLNPPYAYAHTLQSTDQVTSVVTQYAGTGKLADPLQQTCVFSSPLPMRYTLSVSTSGGNGNGSVTSSPAGIECGITCTADFDYGTVVTLTAVPAVGSTFTGWSGACVGGSPTCTLTMDASKNVTATFSIYYVYLPIIHSYIPSAQRHTLLHPHHRLEPEWRRSQHAQDSGLSG